MLHPLPPTEIADLVSDISNYIFDFFIVLLPILLSYGGYLWMFSDDDLERKARGKNMLSASLVIGLVLVVSRLLLSTFSASDTHNISVGFLTGVIFIALLLVGCFVWALVAVLVEKKSSEASSEESGQALPAKAPVSLLPKQSPAPALPGPRIHTRSELFRTLDAQFEQVVQVRRGDYESGSLPLDQWQQRYDALLAAKQEVVETEELQEKARRLDEWRAAGTITQVQYDLRLEELRTKTMQALLKRADQLHARQKRSAGRQAHRDS